MADEINTVLTETKNCLEYERDFAVVPLKIGVVTIEGVNFQQGLTDIDITFKGTRRLDKYYKWMIIDTEIQVGGARESKHNPDIDNVAHEICMRLIREGRKSEWMFPDNLYPVIDSSVRDKKLFKTVIKFSRIKKYHLKLDAL